MCYGCNTQMILYNQCEPNFEENCSLTAANLWLQKTSLQRSSFSYFVQCIFLWKSVPAPWLLSSDLWHLILYVDANTSKKSLRLSGWLRQVLLKAIICLQEYTMCWHRRPQSLCSSLCKFILKFHELYGTDKIETPIRRTLLWTKTNKFKQRSTMLHRYSGKTLRAATHLTFLKST